MPISDAKRKADRKWRDTNLDKICVQYRKGTKDTWKQYAEARGLSLAELIKQAVENYVKEQSRE